MRNHRLIRNLHRLRVLPKLLLQQRHIAQLRVTFQLLRRDSPRRREKRMNLLGNTLWRQITLKIQTISSAMLQRIIEQLKTMSCSILIRIIPKWLSRMGSSSSNSSWIKITIKHFRKRRSSSLRISCKKRSQLFQIIHLWWVRQLFRRNIHSNSKQTLLH